MSSLSCIPIAITEAIQQQRYTESILLLEVFCQTYAGSNLVPLQFALCNPIGNVLEVLLEILKGVRSAPFKISNNTTETPPPIPSWLQTFFSSMVLTWL